MKFKSDSFVGFIQNTQFPPLMGPAIFGALIILLFKTNIKVEPRLFCVASYHALVPG